MLKISKDIKYKNIPENIVQLLGLLPVGDIKVGISLFTFVVLDLIAVLPIIADPFIKELFITVVPFLVFINLWAIALLVRNVYSTQRETVFFFGSLGGVSAICFFVLSQKLAYFVVGMESITFLVISAVVYICTVIYFIYYYNKKTYSLGKGDKSKEKQPSWSILYSFPALGYIVYHSFIKESQFLHLAMVFVFFMLGTFFIYISVKFLHKYFFIRANIHFVSFQKPGKKEKKQALVKGKEIKIK